MSLDNVIQIHDVGRDLRIVARLGQSDLSTELEAEVQSAWDAEGKTRSGALFDGKIFSIDELAPDRITGVFVDYRLFVAQRRQPDLFSSLCVRPLAVSGMIESPDGLIFGLRNTDLTTDGEKWELVPSGGLDPDICLQNCTVDYMAQFYAELADEIGLSEAEISGAVPFALVEDSTTHVFDLGIVGQTSLRATHINLAFSQEHREYSELRLVEKSQLADFCAEQLANIVPATAMLLRHRGLTLSR
jgi:hypothetical protein